MRFGKITHFLTGVAIPVFSIRSEESCGTGEFLDLIKVGKWCSRAGLDLIQILPVNDTGADPSPYSARSAFALHPMYMRLQEVEGMEKYSREFLRAKSMIDRKKSINYEEVNNFKKTFLMRVFLYRKEKIKKDKDLASWISKSTWVKEYSVFCVKSERENKKPWQKWDELRDPSTKDISKFWNENQDGVLFHAWVQYELERQLRKTVDALDEMGIKLKGDIPIMINVNSADVWAQRKFFDLGMKAGAPPDMFSDRGQNWGLPCYDWNELSKDGFDWWKRRLKQASKFYHAYRIDHVLGFFRIWQIPEGEVTGVLGRFSPSVPMTRPELWAVGIDDELLKSLMEPRCTERFLMEQFGGEGGRVIGRYFSAGNGAGEMVFSDNIKCERDIEQSGEERHIKEKLFHLYWNRAFVPAEGKSRVLPTWFHYKTRVFNDLPADKRAALKRLIDENNARQDTLWRDNALKLLKMMSGTTDMLVCAEDLGAVPDCVPGVLKELGILSLKIERWARQYDKPGSPFIAPGDYPRLSVCSPSGHDTSTLRGLWEENGWDRENYYRLLGLAGQCPNYLTSEISKAIIQRNLDANSLLCIFPLQDFLGLYYNLRTDNPADERINVPGIVAPENWAYRMKTTIEFLIGYDEYNDYVKWLVEGRRKRKPE
jgi:4-alpha-glucanotransferase